VTPIKAIRAKCLDCCCNNPNEVSLCPCTDCSLYPYRFGKNPNIQKRELTEEQKQEARERMKRNFAKRSEEGVESENF
jgi:hypothetical protein